MIVSMSELLQWATSATGKNQILEELVSDFLQPATSATIDERVFITKHFCNE